MPATSAWAASARPATSRSTWWTNSGPIARSCCRSGCSRSFRISPSSIPTKDEFDLVRAIEYSASPIHYIVGRDDTSTASAFITDLRNGDVEPGPERLPRLLAGHEHRRRKGSRRRTGATRSRSAKRPTGRSRGSTSAPDPISRCKTSAEIDPALAAVFASPTPVYVPNTSFYMSNDTREPVRAGRHRRVPRRASRGPAARRGGAAAGTSGAGRLVRRRELPLPAWIRLRTLRARRQTRHQRARSARS